MALGVFSFKKKKKSIQHTSAVSTITCLNIQTPAVTPAIRVWPVAYPVLKALVITPVSHFVRLCIHY